MGGKPYLTGLRKGSPSSVSNEGWPVCAEHELRTACFEHRSPCGIVPPRSFSFSSLTQDHMFMKPEVTQEAMLADFLRFNQ
jgi:hypothetical protein